MPHTESLSRWVWEDKRGNQGGENATLTFGTDGNLIGRCCWPSGLENQHCSKGAVGLKLLPTGQHGAF
ncbi:hypothetical protein ACFX11_031198 [Malus domestica]